MKLGTVVVLLTLMTGLGAAEARFERIFGWGGFRSEQDLIKLRDAGFTDLICSWRNPELNKLAKEKYKLRLYVALTPSLQLWRRHRPGTPVPRQVLTAEEELLFQQLQSAAGRRRARTRFGGQPEQLRGKFRPDMLMSSLLCLNHPETRKVFQDELDLLAAKPGVDGIAFDFVGYMNFRFCRCERCETLRRPTGLTPERFARQTLIDFNNRMIARIKAKHPGLLTVTHLYPVFLPDELYGRDLKFDFCGETVAWYFPWPVQQISDYTRKVAAYPAGVPFVGYYNSKRHPEFPLKDATRIDLELRTILNAGGRRVMVCSSDDVIQTPEIAAVFQRYRRNK